MEMSIRCARWWVVVVVLTWLVGCGHNGPTRYDMSGKVTFQGQPVPSGTIAFEPVEGGIGGGHAFIEDGKYDTSESGRGHLGGQHKVRISGNTGELINPNDPDSDRVPLFSPYETTIDLPGKSGPMDFEVPANQK